MKKVLEAVGTFNDGGVESLVKDYCLKLNRDKLGIYVFSTFCERKSAATRTVCESGIEITSVYSKMNTVAKLIRKTIDFQYVYKRFETYIDNLQPDIIHMHKEMPIYVAEYLKKHDNYRPKLFYTAHSGLKEGFDNVKLLESIEFLLKMKGLVIIALHEDMRKELNNYLGINNTVIVPNGIDLNKFACIGMSKNEAKNELGISEECFVLGNVGRFGYPKNHEFILRIFADVRNKKNGSCKLILVGQGRLSDESNDIIDQYDLRNDIIVLQHRNDIDRILRAMDVFVMPSFYEGFPLALLEAEASGIKCVVSDSINSSVYLTNKVFPLSLSMDEHYWSDVILGNEINERIILADSLEKYDVNHTIGVLERLYLNE